MLGAGLNAQLGDHHCSGEPQLEALSPAQLLPKRFGWLVDAQCNDFQPPREVLDHEAQCVEIVHIRNSGFWMLRRLMAAGTLQGMNTPTTPQFAPALTGLVHHSTRTAITTNRDPETGKTERAMTTSRLTLAWEHGELRVRCDAGRVQLHGGRPERAALRRRSV